MPANVKSMCYFGETPWHNLGKRLNEPATAAEAIVAAGLDYHVQKEPLYLPDGVIIPDKFGTVRTDLPVNDPERYLGVVGQRYEPLQNIDAFRFFDSIVGEGKAIYHTAGALGRGEQVWMLAKLPGVIKVVGDDITEKYLLLSNSHDGSSCVRAKFTPIRVVCQNTLHAALNGDGKEIMVRHTQNAEPQLKLAGQLIKNAHQHFDVIADLFRLMAKCEVTQEQLDKFLLEICPDNPKADTHARTENIRNRIWDLFEAGRGNKLQGVRGTAWAAFNAATEFVDHVRNPAADMNNRLKSIWFGNGAEFKQKAFNAAMRMTVGALN